MGKINLKLLLLLSFFCSSLAWAETLERKGMVATKDQEGIRISDSLVSDLSCERLTESNVLTKLQPDAFSLAKHIPVTNWAANSLGQCWSLSLTQREFFYLLRFQTGRKSEAQEKNILNALLEISRGASPNRHNRKCIENPRLDGCLTALNRRVIPLADHCLNCESPESSPTIQSLLRGDAKTGRDFRSEIELKQKDRFYDPGNLDLVLDERERSEDADASTMAKILKNMQQGRMPLVIIRADVTAQHVVLVTSIQEMAPGEYQMNVYDSNRPKRNNILIYAGKRFYAPSIVRAFTYNDSAPVGVFLRDEDEMDDVQEAVYEYYKKVCDSLTKNFR